MHTHGYISILFCIHIRRDASMTWAPQNLLVDHHKFPLEIFHGFWGVPHKKPPKYHIAGDISNIYISHITSHKIQVQYYVYHRCSCLKTVEDG